MRMPYSFMATAVTGRLQALRAGESDTEDGDKEQDSDKGKGQDPNEEDDDKEQDSDKKRDTYTRAEMEKANSQAAKYRTDLRKTQDTVKQLQAKIKEFDDANKTELQKAQDAIKQLEDENKKLAKNSILSSGISVAVRFNAHDPDVVAKLLDPESDESAEDQIKSLVKTKPFLFKSNGDGDGGKGGERGRDHSKSVSMNDLIRGKT